MSNRQIALLAALLRSCSVMIAFKTHWTIERDLQTADTYNDWLEGKGREKNLGD